MADGTKIEWTDATVNYVNGCSVVSPGCTNCYAMRLAGTRLRHHPSRAGLTMPTKAGPVWTGEVRANETALLQPLRWRRPRMIFWNAHGDLFHPNVPEAWIDRQFAVMAMSPQHTHQVLTKRPDRMRAYFDRMQEPHKHLSWVNDDDWDGAWTVLAHALEDMDIDHRGMQLDWPLPNVWLGVSVEDQKRADERIPDLLATPAAVRFLSCEPLLGPLDLRTIDVSGDEEIAPLGWRWLDRLEDGEPEWPRVDWVICGGESGPKARPMHPGWARSLRDQCAAAGVPFFFKQFGEWAPDCFCDGPRPHREIRRPEPGKPGCMFRCGKKAAGRLLDGVQHDGMPEMFRG
ncbi:MAG: hypothetical protein QOH47_2373 [Sphingomonadales bacterium]|jgi:protein gp37|nr:hypothetical protein [Sphingomonadales bacterium]